MSTATSPPPADILSLLARLRSRIRRYVLFEGTASVLVVLGVAFWASLAIDYGLELPRGVRAGILIVIGSLALCTLVSWVLLRLFREFHTRALALVLERRFPSLNDRLITTVELAGKRGDDPALTASMLRRTAEEVSHLAGGLRLREVFNVRPLVRAVLAAVCLFGSIAVFGWAFDDVVHLWFRRNLLLADEYWPRDTDLSVFVLADPGERRVEFKNGVYKHPRGSDLTFLAVVPPGRTVPEQVQLRYDLVSRSGGGRDYLTKVGGREFKHTMAGLHDSLELTLRGGDYSTRLPYHVEVVDPPRIDRIVLHSLYPAYTGKNERDEKTGALLREPVMVQGVQVSLPAGTDFQLQATVNKPLVDVRIQTGPYEIRATKTSATIKLVGPDLPGAGGPELPLPVAQPLLAADGISFAIPFLLATQPTPEFVSPQGQPHLPLRLPPDAVLRISLHDEDEVISGEPARLTINSNPDEPPRIETQLKGIGNAITRQAVIPVAGTIEDDYGIADARFDYKLDTAEGFEKRAFDAPPAGQKKFEVGQRFEVLPLDLAIGRKLTLTVAATDADNLTGPHVAHGEKYAFQIVSNDELLALIAVRELNLRSRFEQILEEVKQTRKDLQFHKDRLDEAKPLRAQPPEKGKEAETRDKLAAIENAVISSADRAISGTRKNANETVSVEQSFRDIREELENNAVPDVKPMLDRIDVGITRPLHAINTIDYNNVDDALALLKKSLEEKTDPNAPLDGCRDRLDVTITHMEAVLVQMLKLETFNEALQLLRDIIKSQEELQNKTKSERKKKLLEDLK